MRPSQTLSVLRDAARDFARDQAPVHAAALAFYTGFSLTPVLVVTVTLAGLVLGRSTVEEKLVGQFGSLMGEKGAELVQTLLENANQPKQGALATILGVLAIIVGASGTFTQLKSSLNTIWGVTAAPKPSAWYASIWRLIRSRLLSFAMVLVIAFLLLASLVISAGVAAVGARAGSLLPAQEVLLQIVNAAISLAAITVLLALIFKYMPDAVIGWREVWFGAFITAVLFELGKFAIGLYLGKSGVATAYGAAGSVVLVLLWLYYTAMIFLMGAEITQAVTRRMGKEIKPAPGYVRRERPSETKADAESRARQPEPTPPRRGRLAH